MVGDPAGVQCPNEYSYVLQNPSASFFSTSALVTVTAPTGLFYVSGLRTGIPELRRSERVRQPRMSERLPAAR